ncbi:MAG: hypothetical protein LBD37_06875 [Treponema sp.]|jgi:hypothetical protein|nr:hypothetical protein [Treponema sp.]
MNNKALGKKAAAFLGAALVCLAAGCATTYPIEWHKVELSADRPDRGPLLNLQNAGQWIDRWENIKPDYFAYNDPGVDVNLRELKDTVEERAAGYFYSPDEVYYGYYLAYFTYGEMLYHQARRPPKGLFGHLRIYDSQGNPIRTFRNFRRLVVYTLHKDWDLTANAGAVCSALLEDLLRQADSDSRIINSLLEAPGPVLGELTLEARIRMGESFKNP